MTTSEELLRRLAIQDESVIPRTPMMRTDITDTPWLQQRPQALVRLGALVALGACVVSYQAAVTDALAAGATAQEIVGALIAVAPLVGVPRVTAAAPVIAAALGYELDRAFEHLDELGGGPASVGV